MKKLLSIVLCAATISVFGETPVFLGRVGVTEINSGLSNTIVAVSYDDLALASGSGIVVSNFVKTTNLTVGDQLAIFNNGEYTTWILTQGKGDAKFWAKNDKTFKINAKGEQVDGTGPQASGISQAVGAGIWLVRQKPVENGKVVPFYIYGKPVTNPTSTTAAGTWTLIGNPNQTGSKEIVVSHPTDFDQIVVPNATNGNLCYYTYKSGKGWRTTNGTQWVDGNPPKLGAGLGCWIWTQETCTINW